MNCFINWALLAFSSILSPIIVKFSSFHIVSFRQLGVVLEGYVGRHVCAIKVTAFHNSFFFYTHTCRITSARFSSYLKIDIFRSKKNYDSEYCVAAMWWLVARGRVSCVYTCVHTTIAIRILLFYIKPYNTYIRLGRVFQR